MDNYLDAGECVTHMRTAKLHKNPEKQKKEPILYKNDPSNKMIRPPNHHGNEASLQVNKESN